MLRAVFSVLMTLRYCDENVPALDKIYYFVCKADSAFALLHSYLYCPMAVTLNNGVYNEVSAVVGMVEEEEYCSDEDSRWHRFLIILLFYFVSHFSAFILVMGKNHYHLRWLIKKYG